MKYTENMGANKAFREWSAYTAVAAALENRCWIQTSVKPCWPNMFTMLLAPPGVGKSLVIDPIREIVAASGMLKITPTKMTRASFEDYAAEVCSSTFKMHPLKRQKESMTPIVSIIDEFGNFMSSHDQEFLSLLTSFWNCDTHYESTTRAARKDPIQLDNLCMSMLVGTQPMLLGSIMPETAWSQGFMTRVIMVYSAERAKIKLFTAPPPDDKLKQLLIKDYRVISTLSGEFAIEEPAKEMLGQWMLDDCPVKPIHPKLQDYNSRRILHVMKLCMARSASRSNNLTVTEEDVRKCIAMLLEAEENMPQVFLEMSNTGGYGEAYEELWAAIWQRYQRDKKPIKENFLYHFLQSRMPAVHIQYGIEMMLRANMIKHVGATNKLGSGNAAFKPVPRTEHGT